MSQSRFLREAREVLYPTTDRTSYDNARKEYRTERNYYGRYDEGGYSESDTNTSGYSSGYARDFIKNNSLNENKKANFGDYKRGITVKHVKFGVGTVIDVKGNGENIIVDVAFKGVGIKSLSVKFAPMEIING